jgi:2-polyprenyl-3-methyl-5-hydroxy-6-metoxy-1,4-benzoquinol methylase
MSFQYRTRVDENLSPFSDEYYNQQVALYEEISGRKLNQWDGELHTGNITPLLTAPNPLGNFDPTHVAEHVRALSAMLSICGLREGARILDMGAGHGLSSEIFAFCGCKVHAIDIDPLLGELSLQRSGVRNLWVQRSTLNFDDLSTVPDKTYAAAFFFQSLHHCLRPWTLIAALKTKLVDGGFIAFTGEPIQTQWWTNWGIRLDEESIHVAKAHGWFESGWSRDFIEQCFERNGMKLELFSGGHGGGEIGIASAGPMDGIKARVNQLGHRPADIRTKPYLTQIGTADVVRNRPGFRVAPGHSGGCLLHGPYVNLKPGRYAISFELEREGTSDSYVNFDVTADVGRLTLYSERLSHPQTFTRIVEIKAPVSQLEARLFVHGSAGWACTHPEIRQV